MLLRGMPSATISDKRCIKKVNPAIPVSPCRTSCSRMRSEGFMCSLPFAIVRMQLSVCEPPNVIDDKAVTVGEAFGGSVKRQIRAK